MEIRIQNGVGDGSLAKVNKNNQLETFSVGQDIAVESNSRGEAFIVSSERHNLAASTETNVLYFENSSSDREVIIDEFHISHNGGDTNGDKLLDVKIYVAPNAPTANNTQVIPSAANTGSTVTAPVTQYVWDGVGSGLTTSFQGVKIGETFYQKGFTVVPLPTKFIVAPGQKIMVSFEMAEIAKASLTAYIHLSSKNR